MHILIKLAARDLFLNWKRLIFPFSAAVLVSCLATWYAATMDFSHFQEKSTTKDFHSTCEMIISSAPQENQHLIDILKQSKSVKDFYSAEQITVPVETNSTRHITLQAISAEHPPFELESGNWFTNIDECVISSVLAEQLSSANQRNTPSAVIGTAIPMNSLGKSLVVTGIIQRPPARKKQTINQPSGTFIFGFGLGLNGLPQKNSVPTKQNIGKQTSQKHPKIQKPSVYISPETLAGITGKPFQPNRFYVRLDSKAAAEALATQITNEASINCSAAEIAIVEKESTGKSSSESGKTSLTASFWSTGGIVLLASGFIIFTTLNMSLADKVRSLGLLRTIGFTKTQILCLIMIEGVILGISAWPLGIFSGWLLLFFQTKQAVTPQLSPAAILFSFLCSSGAILPSAAVPALRAAGVSPVETKLRKPWKPDFKQEVTMCCAGIFILSVLQLAMHFLPLRSKVTFFCTAGIITLGAGFLLMFPFMLAVHEKLFIPVIAYCLRFHRVFLSNILRAGKLRTLCTAISAGAGLSLFTAVHIWSASMLNMFKVPKEIPDTLVRFHEGILKDINEEDVLAFPGVIKDSFMRTTVSQPDFNADIARKLAESGITAGNTVIMGIEPEIAFGDTRHTLRLKFTEGNRELALKTFKHPELRPCLIPETLSFHGNLHLGDKLDLQTERGTIAYTVVGVLDFPWGWMSKCSGVRVSSGRTGAVIFAPLQCPVMDFKARENEFYWFDTETNCSYQAISEYMKQLASAAAKKNPDAIRIKSYSGGTLWDSGINSNFVQVSTIDSMNKTLLDRTSKVIQTMEKMPLLVLVLSTLAILNTMFASVRSRARDFTILEVYGCTRAKIVFLVLGESILLCLCACSLSLAAGIYYSKLTLALVDAVPVFGVISPPLCIPWRQLASGYLLALGLSTAAGISAALLRSSSLKKMT